MIHNLPEQPAPAAVQKMIHNLPAQPAPAAAAGSPPPLLRQCGPPVLAPPSPCPPALPLPLSRQNVALPSFGPKPPACYYELSDSNIFWMNSRPYWIHGTLGRGGFGCVYKVEMLIPFGMEVARDPASGALLFDEDGAVCVCRRSSSAASNAGEEDSSSGVGCTMQDSVWRRARSVEGAAASNERDVVDVAVERQSIARALIASQAAPASMRFSSPGLSGPPQKQAGFFRVSSSTEEEPLLSSRDDPPFSDTESANWYFGGAAADEAVGGENSAATSSDVFDVRASTNVFDVRAGRFVHGSSVFFALKIQGGRDARQMQLFLREVEQLRQLQGKECTICSIRRVVEGRVVVVWRSTK